MLEKINDYNNFTEVSIVGIGFVYIYIYINVTLLFIS